MPRNARATFTGSYLPYPLPNSAIADDPLSGVMWSLCFNANWAPYILGALKVLCRPEIWSGTAADIASVTQNAHTLMGQIREFCGVNPIGTIFAYATANPPDNSLACDGATHLRTDFPALYAILAPAFITDSDHFITPDLRGRTILGTGQGAGLTNRIMNDSGGEENHQLTVAELASHFHTMSFTFFPLTVVGPGELPDSVVGAGTLATNTTGGDGSHNNMQPWRALGYAIVAK